MGIEEFDGNSSILWFEKNKTKIYKFDFNTEIFKNFDDLEIFVELIFPLVVFSHLQILKTHFKYRLQFTIIFW